MHKEVLVWDIEDSKEEEQEEPQGDRLRLSTQQPLERMKEAYKHLNALCAEWETTALSTVEVTAVMSAEYLCLDISLKTVVNDKGLTELQDQTIPTALHLLTMIYDM
uniref:Uncharacterized protein n=1 Tax=Moniliophthora roreri TaxID=221103 RepID=A0A0W0FDX6_MONRR